jgi:cytochrome c5
LALLCLLSCGEQRSTDETRREPVVSTDQDALLLASAKVALPPPGVTRADLPDPDSEAAQLHERYCTACHALATPQIHSAADWPRVFRRMWLRMEGLAGPDRVPIPSSAERTVMLRYFIEHAIRVSGVSLPAGPNRGLYVAVCSRCHELADPRQYPSADWLAVVERMDGHLATMLNQPLPPEEQAKIVAYLDAASAPRRGT